jgi:hypothetical protein
MSGIMRSHSPTLRAIADRLKLESVSKVALRPGVSVVYRITAHYFDARAQDSVATLCRMTIDRCFLELVYARAFSGKSITYPIPLNRYAAWTEAMSLLKFDHMDDQTNVPDYPTVDLWLIERAAGIFRHEVMLAPELATGDHGKLVNAVKNGLPEAIKRVE